MPTSPKRLGKIVSILSKYGFADLISGSKLEAHLSKIKPDSKISADLTKAERIRMVFEELGTTFIKFGQILSQRSDLLPEDLIIELSKLQDKIDPVSIDVSGLIAEAFGQPIDFYFSSFNNIPIGVASIGQVYEGTLKTGEHVVLKIRKPDVDKIVANDLKLMGDLLNVIRNHPAIKEFNPIELFDSFRETLLNELDYQKEANNIKRFGHSYTEDPHIHVPIVYSTLCTKDIICMEFISGLKIDDSESISTIFPDSSRLIELVCNYYFDQILEKGFYHADPHPGNVSILENGQICLIDYGMTGSLLEGDRYLVGDFFFQIINKNPEGIIEVLKEFNLSRRPVNEKLLAYDIDELLNEFDVSLESIDTGEMINKMLAVFNKYQIILPKYFFNLLRTIILLEGLIRALNPEINIMELIKPYARKIMFQRANPTYLIKKMIGSAVGLERNLTKLPALINRIISKAAEDELKINIEAKGLEESIPKIERISNSLILAILVGSLLIASSLIVLSKTPPFLWGIPLLGFMGYVTSAIIAFYIIIKMIRK